MPKLTRLVKCPSQIARVGGRILIVLGLLLGTAGAEAALSQPTPRFSHLQIEDGLSQATVTCVTQDPRGFMWFGTQEGLNRYDGHSLVIYKPDPEQSTSISHNDIYSLTIDREGRLWVGTADGLNLYDRKRESFTTYRLTATGSASGSTGPLVAILQDRSGALWIGSQGAGLYRLDPATGQSRCYARDDADPGSLVDNIVNSLSQDADGTIWIGTSQGLCHYDETNDSFEACEKMDSESFTKEDRTILAMLPDPAGYLWLGTDAGLHRLDPQTKEYVAFHHDPLDPGTPGPGGITSIISDGEGGLWLGSNESGLSHFDPATGQSRHVKHDRKDPHSLADNRILSLFRDRANVLWVGTYSRGIDRFDRLGTLFTPAHSQPGDLSGGIDYVRAFLTDREGNLWVGTDGNGVSRRNDNTGEFVQYMPDPARANGLGTDKFFSLCQDSRDNVWLGGGDGVLYRYRPATDDFQPCVLPLPAATSVRTNTVRTICEGDDGILWLGTDGGGALRFDPRQDLAYRPEVQNDPDGDLTRGRIFSIIRDQRDHIWFGVFGKGVSRLDTDTGRLTHYHGTNNGKGLGNDQIMPLLEDANGQIWIGTNGGGLERLDPDTGAFTHYGEDSGLPNLAIYAVLADDNGNLWLSHNKGLTCLDPRSRQSKNFTAADGLQSNEFNGCAAYRSSDGEMFFGGIDGYNRFHPDDIRISDYLPSVVITNFELFNRSVPIGPNDEDRTILSQAISETNEITLARSDRVISFEYAALTFGSSAKTSYSYRLVGLDMDWSEVGQRRFATYNNLAPGQYTFEVRATNAQGKWSDQKASIELNITPAYWQTVWFRGLAVLSILIGIWGFHRYRTRLMRVRASVLEENVQQRTLALEVEIAERKAVQKELAKAHRQAVTATEAKSTFLATMSHEIRTPMNGVIGMAQLLLDSPTLDREDREQVETIHSSGEALLTIINDILDFSKIEAGKMEIESAPYDLHTACLEVAELMAPKAFSKGLDLICRFAPDLPRQYVGDVGRVRQILLNLVGNAVKFTAAGQIIIEVSATDRDQSVKVAVHDSGIGLSEAESTRLFQPFSQADSSTTRRFGGTGLGLTISKKLVELMEGEIGLDSKQGEGSTFWFTMKMPTVPAEPGPVPRQLPATRVLVVDMVSQSAEILREQLTHWGTRPTVVANETDALANLREAAAEGAPYALVIVSSRPRDRDGLTLAAAVRDNPELGESRVLLLSPTSLPQVETKLARQGFAGLLSKPVRPEILLAATALLCRESQIQLPFLTRRVLARLRDNDQLSTTTVVEVPAPGTSARRWRVLVAEDNVVNQRVAKRMLEKSGCQVDLAGNGEEAVQMWLQFPYDIVFMDCRMPEMDGYTATAEIRSREDSDRHTPIVAMTANVMEGDRERCLAAGMDDYLPKPLRMDACHQVLKQWAGTGADELVQA